MPSDFFIKKYLHRARPITAYLLESRFSRLNWNRNADSQAWRRILSLDGSSMQLHSPLGNRES